MCGIAGLAGEDRSYRAEAATVRRMCDAIVHRGPDDDGVWVHGAVGLGMRRLSIIDLPGGHQPIHNEDQTVWVVFNGEIYNFRELRAALQSRGHRFYTNSDTEVIVHLYEDMGSECVHKLRGMFAFAVYDTRSSTLLLARDRLGIKPLHFAQAEGCLWYGSEIKSLLAAAPSLAVADEGALLRYFQFGYIPDPATAFARVQKLPPGHVLEFAQGKVSVRRYWDLPPYGTHTPASEEACLEEMEQRLAEAVQIRLIADVPLGAFLSGGTDSSIVVALMAAASSRPVKTFTIGFPHADFDEAAYARKVAERFGAEHCEVTVEADIEATLTQLTRGLEEPFADSSMLPTFFVSQLARQHVTVVLSGDGGDELFAGYGRYRVNRQRALFDRIPGWAGRMYQSQIYPRLPHAVRGRKLAFNVSLSSPERYLDGISFLAGGGREREYFSDAFLASARALPDPLDQFRGFLAAAPAADPLSRLLYLDTKTSLPADILTKVDRMSMAVSLEVRVPILDHVFVEWVSGLPADWKLRRGQGKYIFRRLAERLGVPREVLYRPKQGFDMPLKHWIRNQLKEEMIRVLLEPQAVQRGYFRRASVERLLQEHFRGARDHSALLWQLLVFELWHRNYLAHVAAAPALAAGAAPG
ncbi:MAG TPA: asparagine synthase (glutamine-hydrolyzing) [Terriglobales bacterium]|nr:asparagine synthase (glutamine-hydrolyzing) [Terriglobales bacterium]